MICLTCISAIIFWNIRINTIRNKVFWMQQLLLFTLSVETNSVNWIRWLAMRVLDVKSDSIFEKGGSSCFHFPIPDRPFQRRIFHFSRSLWPAIFHDTHSWLHWLLQGWGTEPGPAPVYSQVFWNLTVDVRVGITCPWLERQELKM